MSMHISMYVEMDAVSCGCSGRATYWYVRFVTVNVRERERCKGVYLLVPPHLYIQQLFVSQLNLIWCYVWGKYILHIHTKVLSRFTITDIPFSLVDLLPSLSALLSRPVTMMSLYNTTLPSSGLDVLVCVNMCISNMCPLRHTNSPFTFRSREHSRV